MNTNRNRTVLALGIALALAASGASATNGYYTHGIGTKSKGQAGAGSANPEELLILATNPAGLTEVGASLDAGLGVFMPMRYYETGESMVKGMCFSASPADCTFTIGPNDLRSSSEFFLVPFLGRSWKLSDTDAMALAFYGRGGMNTRWEGGTASFTSPFTGYGTYPGTYGGGTAGVDLMQGFLNLSYAHEFADQFSVGASAIFALQRFEARGVTAFAPYTKSFLKSYLTTGMPGIVDDLSANGHDTSYGFGGTIGLRWQPVDMFSIAAAYTTKMTMSNFESYSDLFAEGGGFDMPSTWTVGVALMPTDALTFMFDVQEIKYSDVDSVSNPMSNLMNCPLFRAPGEYESADFEYCLGGDKGPGFGWEDMTVYKIGLSWDLSDTWTWRAGYSFTDQPIPKEEMIFNILAPGVVEDHFTVGFTQTMQSGNELSLAFMYAPKTSVNGPNTFEPDMPEAGLVPQDIELSMKQFELEISYSWKR
jgi:long-chain fatty acid transport protein